MVSAENHHRLAIPTLVDRPIGLEHAVWVERPLVEQGESILAPLAWEELMCRQVGQGHAPVVHIWRHTDGMAIGLRDRRLTYATQAMEQFRQKGTSVCVRPSGGAAVPLHPGIVNLSIILPNPKRDISIHRDFRFMADWISRAVDPWNDQSYVGEIEGAFCPGDYDVSIAGRKFCGIAQRRQAKAYIITAFIIVEGSGNELSAGIRSFYDQAVGEQDKGYPVVQQGTMGSLAELAQVPDVASYTKQLQYILSQGQSIQTIDEQELFTKEEIQQMEAYLIERYDN
ncbi:lipoate--protein ligase family protein [Paenibacillus sp. KACC 21273]|uniref:lipoate--protein ligase family protein n=1 Tax=Paenibacillus sp. KACC 21273 TaxID=3025665 RepID=UPI003FCE3329